MRRRKKERERENERGEREKERERVREQYRPMMGGGFPEAAHGRRRGAGCSSLRAAQGVALPERSLLVRRLA